MGQLNGSVCGTIGAGAVGSYWIRLQKKEGADILVYDITAERAQQAAEDFGGRVVSLEELLAESDWISTAILPLREVFTVMGKIAERKNLLKPGSLLLDHSGVKTGTKSWLDARLSDAGMKKKETFVTAQLNAIEGRDDVEAIAFHLAFRPDVELEGQNVYISPLKPKEGGLWLPKLTQLLESYNAKVYQMTPEQQDMVTLRHQMIPWLALLAAFDAVRKSGSDMSFSDMEKFTTKLSKPFYDLMKRITSGNWMVYWQTMQHHPMALSAAKSLEQSMHELLGRLVSGDETGKQFEVTYNHLKAIAESGSPEQKTGKPVMAEIYYESSQCKKIREVLRLPFLSSPGFSGDATLSVTMIDAGRINELKRAGIPVASLTTYAYKDRNRQPELAFYVRNFPHPDHPQKSGMYFSPMVPKEGSQARHTTQESNYARVQLIALNSDPVINFFMNIRRDPVLSQLPPFVVHKHI